MSNGVRARELGAEEIPKLPDLLPVLPLKDTVLYPFIIVPLSIGRESSIHAVDQALSEHRLVALVAQRDPSVDEPGAEDLYEFGTAAAIMRMLKLPDGRIRILAQGVSRIRVEHVSESEPYLQARVSPIPETELLSTSLELQALVRSAKEAMDRIVSLGKGVSPEVLVLIANLEDPGRLADLIASNLELTLADAQGVLEQLDPVGATQGHRRGDAPGDSAADDAAGDLAPGARRDRPRPTRILPAPTAARDPAGAGRGRRSRGRDRQATVAWARRRASRKRRSRSSSARSSASSEPTPTPRRTRSSVPTSTG